MPSDPLVFDELKLPFIFVPHGEPEPTEWMQHHPEYIKLPATFVPHGGSDDQVDRLAGVHPQPLAPASSTWVAAGSSDPGEPVPQAERAGFAETTVLPDVASLSSDPIAAYRAANSALETAASGYAFGRAGGADPLTGSSVASDVTSANRTHTDAGPAEDPAAPVPFVDDQGKPVLDSD